MTSTGPAIVGFEVADPPQAWTAAGFDVGADGVCQVGGVTIALVGRGRGTGIVGWSLRGLPAGVAHEVDGVPTAEAAAALEPAATHPNGVVTIDHVVLASPDLTRTTDALAAIGAHARRERDVDLGGRPMRQIFFRLGEVILEVVGSPESTSAGPSTLWGLTYTVADIEAAARFFGAHATRVKNAVQPGRRITTLRHQEFGMSVRTALISAPPATASR